MAAVAAAAVPGADCPFAVAAAPAVAVPAEAAPVFVPDDAPVSAPGVPEAAPAFGAPAFCNCWFCCTNPEDCDCTSPDGSVESPVVVTPDEVTPTPASAGALNAMSIHNRRQTGGLYTAVLAVGEPHLKLLDGGQYRDRTCDPHHVKVGEQCPPTFAKVQKPHRNAILVSFVDP